MKLTRIFGFLALFAVSSVFAAQDDALITFSTVGPDKYADGTVVKDGENYALVWLKKDATFGGFKADGTLVDDQADARLLCVFPRAENGRCKETFVQIDSLLVKALGETGDFKLFLLDTRKADGTAAAGGLDKTGVLGYGEVASLGSAGSGTIKTVSIEDAGEAAIASAVPANVPQPVIKAVELKDGRFFITVSRTSPVIRYNVKAGDDATVSDDPAAAVKPLPGDATNDIVLEVPVKKGEKQRFFRVNRASLAK